MKKRTLSFTLLLAILMSVASCGGESGGGTPTTTSDSQGETTVEETTDGFVKDSLPELNYNGDEVNWFCGDYFSAYFDDIYAEDQNGSLVNDSVYNARRSIEEQIGRASCRERV